MSLKNFRALLARRGAEEAAQTMIEYALLAFLLAVTSIIFLSAIGLDISEWMDAVENALGLNDTNSATTATGVDDAGTAAGVN
jgi:Flp pilus assembly pilin Flp